MVGDVRPRYASPDRTTIPRKGFLTVGIGDRVSRGQYSANGVHDSEKNITSEATNEAGKQDSVTQITTSKASYCANRDQLEDENGLRNVANKKRVTFESAAKDTSANSVYCSRTNKVVHWQKQIYSLKRTGRHRTKWWSATLTSARNRQ